METYTQRINKLYGLCEASWPIFFQLSDDEVLMQFCYYSEHKPDRWTKHEWQKRLFMYWHEIEVRGLYRTTDPPMGTFEYPWEKRKLPYLPSDPNNPERETWIESIAGLNGSPRWSKTGHVTKGRKVGYNNSPDEENMGLYRREKND